MARERAFVTFLAVLLTAESGKCQSSSVTPLPNSTANATALSNVTATPSTQTSNTSVTSPAFGTTPNGSVNATIAAGTVGTAVGTAVTAGTPLSAPTLQPSQSGSNGTVASGAPPNGTNSYGTIPTASPLPSGPKPSPSTTTVAAQGSVSTARSALPNSPTSDYKKTIWPVVAAILSIFAFFILLLVAIYCLCCKDIKTVQFDHQRLYDESGEVVFRLDDFNEHRNPRFYDFSPTAYSHNTTPSYGSNLQPPPGSVST
ncbi:endomucin [Lethenteron reissneri]|uniref:endomucin n=1 Tax=Lethenteron reissneri TaxID=7753 RepID=UPI002AB7C238|nr:endomucin [Lethenteron reissneri]